MSRWLVVLLSILTLTACGVFSPLPGSGAPGAPSSATQTPVAPTPTPGPRVVVVANTDGLGVYVRRTPRMDDKLKAWTEGTRLRVTGEERQAGGERWLPVVDPDGNEGWVPVQYVEPAEGEAAPAAG